MSSPGSKDGRDEDALNRTELRGHETLDTLDNRAAFRVTSTWLASILKNCLDTYIRNPATDPVNVSGPVTTTATGPVFPTGETVGDVSAGFPTIDQTNRVTLSIRNTSLGDSIFIVRTSGITLAAAGADRWEIGPNESKNIDLNDSNKVFLVAPATISVPIEILETAG